MDARGQTRLTQSADWLELSEAARAYHERQWAEPYSSTVAFADWIERSRVVQPRTRILDLGAGAGSTTAFLARRFPSTEFIGLDIHPALVALGNRELATQGPPNCRLLVGDIFELDPGLGPFDGVLGIQLVSWLPSFESFLPTLRTAGARWFAGSSLFYDGPVDAEIVVREWADADAFDGPPSRRSPYNIYSLPRVRALLASQGWTYIAGEPFEIPRDLPRTTRGLGTYTERLADGRRLQISGPLLMPWHFVLAARAEGG